MADPYHIVLLAALLALGGCGSRYAQEPVGIGRGANELKAAPKTPVRAAAPTSLGFPGEVSNEQ